MTFRGRRNPTAWTASRTGGRTSGGYRADAIEPCSPRDEALERWNLIGPIGGFLSLLLVGTVVVARAFQEPRQPPELIRVHPSTRQVSQYRRWMEERVQHQR